MLSFVAADPTPPVAAPAADPHAVAADPHAVTPGRLFAVRAGTAAGVLIPLAGVGLAGWLLWGRGFGWVELLLLVGMYTATAMSVTIGFHRLYTHRSFEAVAPVRFLLGVFGSMAIQGPLIEWVSRHRRHHQHSDHPGDPHSPHEFGAGVWGVLRGFVHAHIGWAFTPDPPGGDRYVPDLRKSRLARVVSALFPLWALLGVLLPAAVGGWASGTWGGAAAGLVWGGLVRIFLVHHLTWSINSVCHLWGSRPYETSDQSRNNAVFGVLAFGEGWHNNHHAFPTSARHGLRWWQFDASYMVIRLLEACGLAWQVKRPAAA